MTADVIVAWRGGRTKEHAFTMGHFSRICSQAFGTRLLHKHTLQA